MKPWNINSLRTIGWSDPFPKEAKLLEGGYFDSRHAKICKDEFDLIYPEYRLKEDLVPLQMFIPRREIMFKLMRSCIGITRI